MNTTELYLAIMTIERRKRAANIVPAHALRVADIFKEVKHPPSEIDIALRQLLKDKRIEAHKTMNDVGIITK